MTKKQIILVAILITILIISGALINYFYEKSPKRQIEYNLVEDTENSEKYLSENFLKKIEEDSSVNREFYEENVEDYSLTRKINSIKIGENNIGRVLITNTVVNTKTGFKIVTIEDY